MISIGTNTLGFFSREKILGSTTKVSVVSAIAHKLSAQSHRLPPTSNTNCKSKIVRCIFDLLAMNLTTPSLGSLIC